MLPESYDPLLVALSYVVAFAGSYTGTSLGERLTSPSRRLRVPWFLGLTLVQATCIWSAHFLGWLALRLPVPVAYDLPLTIASAGVAAAGVAGATALFAWEYFRRRDRFPAGILARGALFGLGIAGLHYTVMAAMRMAARTHHSAPWDRASIAFAIVVGTLGIWMGTRYFRADARRSLWLKVAVALIAGTAITGQHYIAMAGADFSPGPDTRPSSEWLLAGPNLPLTVLLTTLVILAGGLVSAGLDRRKAARDAVSWRMLAGRENERRGIARVLHDDVGQLLTALRLNLQRLHPLQGEAAIVGDSVALVDDALTRVRALSLELRPSVLDDLGLAAAVTWYANRQAERAGYTVKVVENVGRKRFDESVETAAFRVVQEALTNVTRHAQAKNIRVSMRLAPPLLDVAIADDGVGFNVADARTRARAGESLGLLDMNEIATLAGATYSIASAPGKGSTVNLSFHLAGD